jgi:hypothetical protein
VPPVAVLPAGAPPVAAPPPPVASAPPAVAAPPPAPIPVAAPIPAAALPSPSLSSDLKVRSRAKLECTAGPISGRMFMLAPGIYRIGKAPHDLPDSKPIVIPNDKWMSKDHAVLIVEPGEVVLTDPGSTNGSFVNGEKITRSVLKNGDELRLGESVFRLTVLGD